MGGSGGDAPVDPCAACPSGFCLPDATCVDCLPDNDHCPDGKYCSAQNACVPGCKNDASCASGVCGIAHDCQSCISDQECSEAHVCGAQQCASACTVAQEGGNAGCGTGLTCCSLHCVDTNNDSQHCGACGTACSTAQFCGASGCVTSKLSSLCEFKKVVVVLDGQFDDPIGRSIAQTLVTQCPTAPAVREVAQTVADAVNPNNGRPVTGGDELIILAGGNAVQIAANYVMTQKVAPLTNALSNGNYEIRNTATNMVIASEPVANATASHDLFALEFMRDSTSDSLLLDAYGFTTGGTAAAALYLDESLAPTFATATKAWYVGEWTDANGDNTPQIEELVLLGSGG
jgi:hypothetical protein